MTSTDRRAPAPIVGLILLAFLSGCSLLRRPEPPVDRSHDPRIHQEVEARLAQEPAIAGAGIRVEVDAAIVVLYGSVQGLDAWRCAIRNAQLVEGVQSVVDYLVIEPGPRDIQCIAPRAPATASPNPQRNAAP
jgi:hypothetical protein